MEQKEKLCSNCQEVYEGNICENCSLRCPICNKLVASFSLREYYIGCQHVAGIILGSVNEEIYWKNTDYEKKFNSFIKEHSMDYYFGDDLDSEMEIFDLQIDALNEFIKNEGLELLKHEDLTNNAKVCHFVFKDD